MSSTRRDFMVQTGVGGVALATLQVGCGNDVIAAPIAQATVTDDPTDNVSYGTVSLILKDFPDLALAGGAVTIHLLPLKQPERLRPFKLPSPPSLLVAHAGPSGDPNEYIAVDSACPHAGCPLGFAHGEIQCPCHSSRFRALPVANDPRTCIGEATHGPARQGPTPYQVTLSPDGGTVLIDLKTTVGCGTVHLPALVGNQLTLAIADYPTLAQPGGSLIGRPAGAASPVAIVRVSGASDASAFSALTAVCTHLGCTVDYSNGMSANACGPVTGGGFVCGCHCSKFDVAGAVLQGPATTPLKKYAATFDGTTLTITVV